MLAIQAAGLVLLIAGLTVLTALVYLTTPAHNPTHTDTP